VIKNHLNGVPYGTRLPADGARSARQFFAMRLEAGDERIGVLGQGCRRRDGQDAFQRAGEFA